MHIAAQAAAQMLMLHMNAHASAVLQTVLFVYTHTAYLDCLPRPELLTSALIKLFVASLPAFRCISFSRYH